MTLAHEGLSFITRGVQHNLDLWYLIQELAEVRWYQADSTIIPKKELYLVKDGIVQLDLSFHDRRKPLSIFGKNTVFGEMELFSLDSEFSLSCRTITPAIILVWEADLVYELIRIYPALSFHLLNALLNKMRLLTSQAEAVTQLDTNQRLRTLFIYLANQLGTFKGPDCVEIPVSLTQNQLAELTSSSQASIKRIYQTLKSQGTIKKKSGTYHVKINQLLKF